MDSNLNGRISGFYSRQLVPSQCIRSRKMTGKNANKIDQTSAKQNEDMSLLVWLVRQLSKYAPFRSRRDPDRIKAATKKLDKALKKKHLFDTHMHPLEEEGGYSRFCDQDEIFYHHEGLGKDKWRVSIFKKRHKTLG